MLNMVMYTEKKSGMQDWTQTLYTSWELYVMIQTFMYTDKVPGTFFATRLQMTHNRMHKQPVRKII